MMQTTSLYSIKRQLIAAILITIYAIVGCTDASDQDETPDNSPSTTAVVMTSPFAGETDVDVDQLITVTLDGSISSPEFDIVLSLTDETGNDITGQINPNSESVEFTPTQPLMFDMTYTASITNGENAESLIEAYQWSFSTPNNSAPTAQDGAVSVPYNSAGHLFNLSSLVSDDPMDIDWSSLVFTSPTHAVVTQDNTDAFSLMIRYAGTDFSGSESIQYRVADGEGLFSNWATITISVSAPSEFDYITDRRIIAPDYGSTVPAKGERRIDPVTGIAITRLTDTSELIGTDDAFIVYSRYSPENSNGNLLLIFGENSTSSWVVERSSGNVVKELKDHQDRQIGENQEVRWDLTGNRPNRVYFRTGMQFYYISDVTLQNVIPTLIKDFAPAVPNATTIYNDVEGDSSNDSDHWAFMAAHYNGSTYVVDAYVHYQISTDRTHILTPADLAGSNLDADASQSTFSYRPNMVEISPEGTGFVMHHSRRWDDSSYGGNGVEWIGTWYDGAWLWPLDFDWNQQTPQKISVNATHSGWSYDKDGKEVFISQNNRTDRLDAVTITTNSAAFSSNYDTRDEIASHVDFGWSNGFHYGKLSNVRSGWTFVNTYSNVNNASHDTDWAADQLLMIQILPETETPIIWRIGHNYNRYDGNYRDEAPAAVNIDGNRIYLSNNWGGQLDHREVFVYDLPDNWHLELESL